jgi:hypothetical protein
MNSIAITVTGRLGDDPRTFTTKDGTDGVELRLALDLPSRSPAARASHAGSRSPRSACWRPAPPSRSTRATG